MAVEGRRDRPERVADPVHAHLRDPEGQEPLDEQRHRAALHRLGREVMPVGAGAGDAREQVARPDLGRAVAEPGDADGGAPADLRLRQVLDELAQGAGLEGTDHDLRAYRPRARLHAHRATPAVGGGGSGRPGSMPSLVIAARATSWNRGAAATPP
ncbi:hypothetical protein HRbin12_01224 [bacterium HR12]|nr:hypothetical protein HRbin12_01224 [bacterium HR12]